MQALLILSKLKKINNNYIVQTVNDFYLLQLLCVENYCKITQNERNNIESDNKQLNEENYSLKNLIENKQHFVQSHPDSKSSYTNSLNNKKISELMDQNKKLTLEYTKLKNSIVGTINAFKTNDEGLEKFIQELAEIEHSSPSVTQFTQTLGNMTTDKDSVKYLYSKTKKDLQNTSSMQSGTKSVSIFFI